MGYVRCRQERENGSAESCNCYRKVRECCLCYHRATARVAPYIFRSNSEAMGVQRAAALCRGLGCPQKSSFLTFAAAGGKSKIAKEYNPLISISILCRSSLRSTLNRQSGCSHKPYPLNPLTMRLARRSISRESIEQMPIIFDLLPVRIRHNTQRAWKSIGARG